MDGLLVVDAFLDEGASFPEAWERVGETHGFLDGDGLFEIGDATAARAATGADHGFHEANVAISPWSRSFDEEHSYNRNGPTYECGS